jgi:hypothetical protein
MGKKLPKMETVRAVKPMTRHVFLYGEWGVTVKVRVKKFLPRATPAGSRGIFIRTSIMHVQDIRDQAAMTIQPIEIKKWLLEQGLTSAAIARRARVSQPLVSLTIKGARRSGPGALRVLRFLRRCGCPREFLGNNGHGKKAPGEIPAPPGK